MGVLNVQRCNTIINFIRSSEVQQKYDKWKAKILLNYKSISDYIYIHFMKYKYELIRGKFVATKPDNVDFGKTFIIPNKFPYELDKNIKQYTLWHNSRISVKEVNDILSKHFPNKKFFWYYSHRKSVRKIPHIHVFVSV